MSYTVLLPSITAVSLSPNPITASSSLTIVVSATEIEKILEPVYFYSGEIYSGEVW